MNSAALALGFWRRYWYGLSQHSIAAEDVAQEAAALVCRHGDHYPASSLWADLFDWMRQITQARRQVPARHIWIAEPDDHAAPQSVELEATGLLAVMQATDDLPLAARIVLRMMALGATYEQAGNAAGVTGPRAWQLLHTEPYGRLVAKRLQSPG